jgi:hypothetical protein
VDLDRAIDLNPANIEYRLLRGTEEDLRAATGISPAAAAWIRLAVVEEMRGNFAAAESALQRALAGDRTFAPRWSLANFYFRRAEWAKFWHWAAEAAQISSGDLTALYQLCLHTGAAPAAVYERVVPARAKARLEFALLVAREGKIAEAEAAAVAVANDRRPKDHDALLEFCEQALAAGEPKTARAVWNAMNEAAPDHGIANGGFRRQPTGRCMDWTVRPAGGLSIYWNIPGLAIELSGLQPDPWVLLRQPLALTTGRTCRLRYRYQATAAVEWRVGGAASPPFTRGEAREDVWEFTAGETDVLELTSSRAPGARRPQGSIRIEWVRLN